MSKPTFFLVTAVVCLLHFPAHALPLALSDSELDATTAGGDLCAYFGIDGPCVASMLQLNNPLAPPQSQEAALPLPSSGTATLTLQASYSSPDGFRTQSATQTNSASSQGSAPSLPTKGIDLSPTSLYMRAPFTIRP